MTECADVTLHHEYYWLRQNLSVERIHLLIPTRPLIRSISGVACETRLEDGYRGFANVTSRTGNAPSCRATAGEKCTESVGRMKSGAHCKRVACLHCELLLMYT